MAKWAIEWVRCGWLSGWLSGWWFRSVSRLMNFFSDFLKCGKWIIQWTD
jgi:hypothetical protein